MKSDITLTLEAIKAPFAEIVAKVDSIPLAVEAGEKLAYDEGYLAGKASVVLPDPASGELLFTQADMDRLAETAKAEKDAQYLPQIDALNVKVAELEGRALTAEQALVDFKLMLKAKYEEAQSQEAGLEKMFGDLLV